MIKNYITIAIRNLLRNKLFSGINILGLAIGMAATLLIVEFILFELSYDAFHDNADNIYSIIIQEEKEGSMSFSNIITSGVGPSIVEEFPEVKSMVRISYGQSGYFSYANSNHYIEDIKFSDSTLLNIFSFEMLSGDPRTALKEPRSIVLSESVAKIIFGKENPLGKMIDYNGEHLLKVTGVVANPPDNSSIEFEAIISFSTLNQMQNVYLGWDGGWNYYTYVQLVDGIYPEMIDKGFEDFMERHINYKYREHGFVLSLIMQPLNEVHLYSGRDYGLEGQGRLTNLYLFMSIAFFILLIACFNFMNLSTARSTQRAREVGIRKVMGAEKQAIIRQFIAESIFISIISLFIAVILVELAQPYFNNMTGRDLQLFNPSGLMMVVIFIIIVVFTGILAGSYPAFFMSRLQAVKIMKGNLIQHKGKPILRNLLVLIQFFISAFLIFGTLVIQSQINFLQQKQLGFNPENIAVIQLDTRESRLSFELIKSSIKGIPGVMASGASAGIPGRGLTKNGYVPEEFNDAIMIHVLDVDDDYLDMMEIAVIQGEGFTKESGLDSVNILINEALMKKLRWENAVGKTVFRNEITYNIIGVVQDFHFAPLSEEIEPLIITQSPWNNFYSLSVKTSGGDIKSTIKQIETEWDQLFPNASFEFFILENYIDDAYREVTGLRKIFVYFSILAIMVACMGLLGLAYYTTSQRSKEVGVRKVFGASALSITRKLTLDFIKWVLVSNIIAIPVAWYLMNGWLNNFAYHAGMSLSFVLYTFLITVGLSFLTIIIQTLHIARSNPAEVLKYE